MAYVTPVGLTSLNFGISDDEASLTTQSVSVTRKSDKKEARDKSGDIIAVAYYNETADIQVSGLGTSALGIGEALSLTLDAGQTGSVYVDEVAQEDANEEFVKTTISATAYSGITS
jgi:hypothetical protein